MSDISDEEHLVPNRECGGCTVCCQYLTIDSPGIVKLPNVPCKNLKDGGGCAIYANWPGVCDKWFCAWRSMPNLGDEWRPDKIKVLIEFSREEFPEPFTGKVGYRFTILDKQKLLSNKEVVMFIAKQIFIGVPCILAYGLGAGEYPNAVFLNIALGKAVQQKNGQAILQGLVKAIEECEKLPITGVKIENDHIVDA